MSASAVSAHSRAENSRIALEAEIGRLLARNGIEFDGVAVVGHAADVAAIVTSIGARAAVAAVSAEIKALGVRYVAIELVDSDDD